MRALLRVAGVLEAGKYATHDMRRGHTQDMVDSGCALVDILLAGDWR